MQRPQQVVQHRCTTGTAKPQLKHTQQQHSKVKACMPSGQPFTPAVYQHASSLQYSSLEETCWMLAMLAKQFFFMWTCVVAWLSSHVSQRGNEDQGGELSNTQTMSVGGNNCRPQVKKMMQVNSNTRSVGDRCMTVGSNNLHPQVGEDPLEEPRMPAVYKHANRLQHKVCRGQMHDSERQ